MTPVFKGFTVQRVNGATDTRTREWANAKMRGKLDEFVTIRRARGDSWRSIRDELADRGVPLSHVTLFTWYGEAAL